MPLRSAVLARRRFRVDLDQLDEVVDPVVGEGHDAFVAEAQDPDEAVLGLHFDGDVEQEVDIFAEVFGDAVDGSDAGDLVDVHGSGREAVAARGCGCQFQGNSSSSRCAGWPAIRARTSASHACGSTPFILAVTMSPYMSAARRPPRSDPQNSHDFRPSATQRSPRSAALFDMHTRPSSRNSVKACQRFSMYWMAFTRSCPRDSFAACSRI